MTRTIGSRAKIARKYNENIFGQKKLDKILAKKPYAPGQHGQKFTRRASDFGIQLKEKQKLRAIYDLSERQFRRYYESARKVPAATGEKLLQLLESRLDNLIFRAGFAPTRASARQLVNHGHVLVDGAKVDIPSYLVKQEQVVSLNPKAAKIPQVEAVLNNKEQIIPKWLKKKALSAKLERLPKREEIDINVQEQLIVEYYSR